MPPTHAAIPSARRTSCDRSSREERDRSGRIRRNLDSFEFLQRASPAIIISAMPHGGRRSGAPSCLALSGDVERLYLHHCPFSRRVIAQIARQIQDIDLGLWSAPQPAPAEDKKFSVA